MFLGIVFHAGIAYMVPLPRMSWTWSTQRNLAFDVGYIALHSFRMPLFFVVCGFFARLLLRRLGVKQFALHRAQRIASPLVLGMVTVVPSVNLTSHLGVHRSWHEAFRWAMRHCIDGPDHLWFLYYLLMFYAASLLVAPPMARFVPAALQSQADRCFIRLVRSPILLIAPVLITAIPLVFTSSGLSIDTPASTWKPELSTLSYYAVFFTFGWFLHRSVYLLKDLKQGWPGYAIVAVVLFALCLLLERAQMSSHGLPSQPLKRASAVAYSGLVWSSVFTFLILCLRYLDRPSRRARYLADASYWFYLVHLPVVLLIQAYLNPSGLNAFVQFLLTLAGTLVLCLCTYHYTVRFTWIGTLLNGRRERG